jgi:hypothetical protein
MREESAVAEGGMGEKEFLFECYAPFGPSLLLLPETQNFTKSRTP